MGNEAIENHEDLSSQVPICQISFWGLFTHSFMQLRFKSNAWYLKIHLASRFLKKGFNIVSPLVLIPSADF